MRKLHNLYGFYLAIGWVIVAPVAAFADEITITLTPEIAYVDTVVQVDTTTAYTITTTTGPRTEVVDSVTVERVAWADSWIILYRGVAVDSGTVIAQDDDSNHNSQTNYFASALSGTLTPDTYTIRATSYDFIATGQRPIGTYTLSSNLINLPDTNTATVDTGTVTGNNQTTSDTSTTTTDTSTATPTNTTEPSSPVPSQPQETVLVPVIPPSLPPQPIEVDTGSQPVPTIEQPELQLPEEVVSEPLELETVAPPLEEEFQEQPILEIEPENLSEEPFDTPIVSEEPITEIEENQEPITAEEVTNLVESLNEDGVLSQADVEIIADALIEQAEGEPISLETLEQAGITYEDLPPSTPVQVREDDNGNAIVITAEVAAALLVLDSPVELLTSIFTDPAQALLALSSIGADMSDEERSESEKTIVAAVIVGGIAIQSATTAALAGSVSYRRRV